MVRRFVTAWVMSRLVQVNWCRTVLFMLSGTAECSIINTICTDLCVRAKPKLLFFLKQFSPPVLNIRSNLKLNAIQFTGHV